MGNWLSEYTEFVGCCCPNGANRSVLVNFDRDDDDDDDILYGMDSIGDWEFEHFNNGECTGTPARAYELDDEPCLLDECDDGELDCGDYTYSPGNPCYEMEIHPYSNSATMNQLSPILMMLIFIMMVIFSR